MSADRWFLTEAELEQFSAFSLIWPLAGDVLGQHKDGPETISIQRQLEHLQPYLPTLSLFAQVDSWNSLGYPCNPTFRSYLGLVWLSGLNSPVRVK